jgi:sugar lactone lactonase YvrE
MAAAKKPPYPEIDQVTPAAAIPGEFQNRGRNLAGANRPVVRLGDAPAPVVIGSPEYVVARVPEGTIAGKLIVDNGEQASKPWHCEIGIQIADSLHPVANPVVDPRGNIYTTFSGSRGQKTPVSVYRIDPSYNVKPFLSDVMNATGLAVDREGMLYISSRMDGIVYRADPKGSMSVWVEGMGVATGIAFDGEENLYVGDRSGTVFKIGRERQIYVFATLEASIAAYHLAFSPDGHLYVTGPTTSSYDCVYRVAPNGDTEVFYRGLGRPQGLAFDSDGNLYVCASLGGRRGVVRITPDKKVDLYLSGPGIVGLAIAPGGAMLVVTSSALYRVDTGLQPLRLLA